MGIEKVNIEGNKITLECRIDENKVILIDNEGDGIFDDGYFNFERLSEQGLARFQSAVNDQVNILITQRLPSVLKKNRFTLSPKTYFCEIERSMDKNFCLCVSEEPYVKSTINVASRRTSREFFRDVIDFFNDGTTDILSIADSGILFSISAGEYIHKTEDIGNGCFSCFAINRNSLGARLLSILDGKNPKQILN